MIWQKYSLKNNLIDTTNKLIKIHNANDKNTADVFFGSHSLIRLDIEGHGFLGL